MELTADKIQALNDEKILYDKFIDAKLQTAVSPSIFSFSTINTLFPLMLSSAETLFAFLVIPPSTKTKSSSSKV